MKQPTIELSINMGNGKVYRYALPVNDELYGELTQTVELSDEPLSLMLASAGMFGGKGNAITTREKVFKMRKCYATHIADLLVDQLIKHFGLHDETDGYRTVPTDKE